MRTRPSRPAPSAFQRPPAGALSLSAVSAEGGPSTRGCTSARPRCRSTEVSGKIRARGSIWSTIPPAFPGAPILPGKPSPHRETASRARRLRSRERPRGRWQQRCPKALQPHAPGVPAPRASRAKTVANRHDGASCRAGHSPETGTGPSARTIKAAGRHNLASHGDLLTHDAALRDRCHCLHGGRHRRGHSPSLASAWRPGSGGPWVTSAGPLGDIRRAPG